MARSTYEKVVAKLKRLLADEKIAHTKLILFGSHAKGWARPNSDIDLCVVVKAKDDQLRTIQSQLNFLAGKNLLQVDIIVTNAKQLRSNRISPILHEIRSHGISV